MKNLHICKHENGHGYCLLNDEYCPQSPCKDEEIITYAPVKRGKWLCKWDSRMGTTEVTCSVCKSSREILGCYVGTHGEHLYDEDDFCPNCGADMRGDQE